MHQDRASALAHSGLVRCSVPRLIGVLGATLLLGGCAGFPWGKGPPNLRGGYAAGAKVAVILPAKGPVADAANAVRDGLRAAGGADDTPTRPTLTFIASDQPNEIAGAYKKALAGGATQVIGPLLKPAVDTLAAGPALKVPTLALNQAAKPGKSADNLYQFALAPETEALEVANKAKAMGFTRALMLAPQGEAGQRRADAFRRQWQRLGGTLVGEAGFDPAAADPAKDLGDLLAKGTADVLFLAADADQVRKVYPAIRDQAVALPVVATSAVYSGDPDAARDKALAGLYFVDAPWVLGVGAADDPLARFKLKKGAAALATPLGLRLYAMGIDAYRLTPRLATLAKTPGATFPGATGTLSIDAQGRVQRQLTLAQFTPSGPHPVTAITAAKASPPTKPPTKLAAQGKPAEAAAAGKPEEEADPPAAPKDAAPPKPAASAPSPKPEKGAAVRPKPEPARPGPEPLAKGG